MGRDPHISPVDVQNSDQRRNGAPTQGDERRAAKRYQTDFRVWVTLPASRGGTRHSGQTVDIGTFGLGICCAVALEVGHRVGLEFTLPGSTQVLQLGAIVRNRRGFHYGLQFLNISPAQQQAIARTCVLLELT